MFVRSMKNVPLSVFRRVPSKKHWMHTHELPA